MNHTQFTRTLILCLFALLTIGHSSVPAQVLQLAELNTGQIRALDKENTIVLIPGACSHTPSPAEPIRDAADTLLLDLHERGLFNGAVVLGCVGEEVYARGFGPANIEAGAAFTPDTPTDGASMAKTLKAAAVLMLHNKGRLRLDDPVRRHLPEYPHTTTRVRHLITHSAGLPEYEFFDQFVPQDEIRTTLGFLSILRERAVEPFFEPGTRFSYNSFGFDISALVVERLTGQRWDVYFRERIFVPLVMNSTFLRPARLADWSGVRTFSYRQLSGGLTLYDVWDHEGFYGGSNLYFSARDLYLWSRSFYTRTVLSDAVLSLGTEPPLLLDTITGEGRRDIRLHLGYSNRPVIERSWFMRLSTRRWVSTCYVRRCTWSKIEHANFPVRIRFFRK